MFLVCVDFPKKFFPILQCGNSEVVTKMSYVGNINDDLKCEWACGDIFVVRIRM